MGCIILTRMPIAPCKDCQDRHQFCHSTCQKYSDWRNKLNEERESKLAHNMKYYDANVFMISKNLKGKINKEKNKNK